MAEKEPCPECNNVRRHRDDCRYGAAESDLVRVTAERDEARKDGDTVAFQLGEMIGHKMNAERDLVAARDRIAQLESVRVAAQAAYDALAGFFVAHHPEEPMGSWVAELRDLGNALALVGTPVAQEATGAPKQVTFRIFRAQDEGDTDGLYVIADGPTAYGSGKDLDAAMVNLAEEIRILMGSIVATPDELCAPDLLEIKRTWGFLVNDTPAPAAPDRDPVAAGVRLREALMNALIMWDADEREFRCIRCRATQRTGYSKDMKHAGTCPLDDTAWLASADAGPAKGGT